MSRYQNQKLGVLSPGLGAVATTMIAGVEAIKLGIAKPVGSLTQMGKVDGRLISDLLPLQSIEKLVFGAWDVFPDNAYESALKAGVLENSLLEQVKPALEKIRPMSAVFDPHFVRRLNGPHVKSAPTKMDLALMLQDDIREFMKQNDLNAAVMIWCGSTEAYVSLDEVHKSLPKFEQGLRENHPAISPSMIYAYAALRQKVPFANGSPNQCVELPAIQQLASQERVPIVGSDLKTGQTFLKTVLAPGFKARLLGLNGWYSTNILGNRDGIVLDDPGSFKTKEVSKRSVLDQILDGQEYPDLYSDFSHVVKINYYPPRGDCKEGWDNIDIFGWLGYPMQVKVNFLCRDSILAAPIVLDLALFLDLSSRFGLFGIQDWLGFYFKSPAVTHTRFGLSKAEHNLFVQQQNIIEAIRFIAGENSNEHYNEGSIRNWSRENTN